MVGVETHRAFHSRFLAADRNVHVWVPPGYAQSPRARYPVLYLHDGQNVFDPETSFVRGQHWQAAESAAALVREGRIDPPIIVAIDNTGAARIDEYTPTHSAHMSRGGGAEQYAQMMLEELMPFVGERYRVRGGPRSTGLGGSSLGGLLTLYIGMRHPDVFGKLAIMSPSLWWDDRVILRMAGERAIRPRPRIWLDTGTAEASTARASTRDARWLRRILWRQGWRSGRNLAYYEDRGGGHNEGAWAHRFPMMLRFLFGR
jgi:predicted alpha/beta superfamily hydrolase